jgi:transposase-like protein
MANHRDPVKAAFWRRVVARWRRSQLTVRDFCRQEQLSEPSFYAWRRTLAERADSTPPRERRTTRQSAPFFVPLRVAAEANASTPPPLEIVLGRGRVVRVPPGFDAATLRQTLAVLEDAPC